MDRLLAAWILLALATTTTGLVVEPPDLVGTAPDPPVGLPDPPRLVPPIALPDLAAPPAPGLAASPSMMDDLAPPALAGVGVAAVLHALGFWRWLAMGGFALYSRISRGDLLDSETRDRVHKLVQSRPGIALTEVAREARLGWGTAVYHLDRLERAGFVASERHAGARCYFPAAGVAREARRGIGALRQETTRSVAEMVAQRPGLSQSELCDALGLTASAASKQVSKLEGAGLVRRERDWKTVRLHPLPSLAPLVARGWRAPRTRCAKRGNSPGNDAPARRPSGG